MGGGGGKGGSVTVGYRYYLSMHMGLSRGPVDEIVQINIGDVRAWPIPDGDSEAEGGLALVAQGPNGYGVRLYENGDTAYVSAGEINTHAVGSGSLYINAPELFGGDAKEGGVQGTLHVLPGHRTQIVPDWIKQMLGGRVPDFRGVTTMWFDGLLCSLNPYPKAWKVRARRTTSGWDGDVWVPSLATIWLRNGSIKAMNPAHIIYETLTNREWGRGFPRALINDPKFTASAQTLYNEGLGLCLAWKRQGELGDFIQQVVDHAGGSLYPDPSTGLMTFELLRGDYDVNALPIFTYDTGLLSIEEDSATQDDVVNEVIVGWSDPIQNKERQARVHNLASLQTMKAVASNTISYAGLPTVELALRIGQRDLKAVATSLKRYRVKLDRRAWKIKPGSVFRVSAPELNIFNVIVRAGKVKKTEIKTGEIEVDAVLDVFGLPATSFIQPEEPAWTPPDRTARVITQRLLREATYRDVVRLFSEAERATFDPTSSALAVVAARPSALTQSYRIYSKIGAEAYAPRGAGSFVPVASAISAMNLTDTVIAFEGGSDLGLVELGTLVQIGNEFCRLESISQIDSYNGSITVARGCIDSLPATHAAGTSIFFIGNSTSSDMREYVQGEVVNVKLLSHTSTSELSEAAAPVDTITVAARPSRPWPMGNLRINGVPYAVLPEQDKDDILLTWEHRNRLIIQDQLVSQSEAGTAIEPDSSYTIRVYSAPAATVPVRTISGLTGTSFTYTTVMMVADGIDDSVTFELEAVRGGMKSTFLYRVNVDVDVTFMAGYGRYYGLAYGP